MALVASCVCYCILRSAWHVTKTHAGCTGTVFMEPAKETAVKTGKTLHKALMFVLVHLPSDAGVRSTAKKK